jgi:hypothetical protein
MNRFQPHDDKLKQDSSVLFEPGMIEKLMKDLRGMVKDIDNTMQSKIEILNTLLKDYPRYT